MNHIDTYLSDLKPQIEQLHQIINNNQSFLLIGHSSPDGDCIGSLLAFGTRLEKQGKQVYYVTPTKYNKNLSRIWSIEKISYTEDNKDFEKLPNADVKVFLDLSGIGLLGKYPELFLSHPCKQSVCIDHHLYPSIPVDCMVSDIASSSCAELLREIMSHLGSDYLDNQIASLCYLGMITDTGEVALSAGFVREKDSIRTFENALGILKAGADKKYILDHLGKLTLEQLQFLSKILERIEGLGELMRTRYESTELEEYNIIKEEADLGFDIARKIDSPVSVRFACYPDYIHCSLRAKDHYDVQTIANSFGGGGHKKAAGCRVARTNQDIQTQLRHIAAQINTQLQAQKTE